jgi:hypothetical protein
MRSFLTTAKVVACLSVMGTSSGAAQQSPLKEMIAELGARTSPGLAVRQDYERSVADYRKCIADKSANVNACEALRHIMDVNAQVLSVRRPASTGR